MIKSKPSKCANYLPGQGLSHHSSKEKLVVFHDKPGGIEEGEVFCIQNEEYFDYLKEVLQVKMWATDINELKNFFKAKYHNELQKTYLEYTKKQQQERPSEPIETFDNFLDKYFFNALQTIAAMHRKMLAFNSLQSSEKNKLGQLVEIPPATLEDNALIVQQKKVIDSEVQAMAEKFEDNPVLFTLLHECVKSPSGKTLKKFAIKLNTKEPPVNLLGKASVNPSISRIQATSAVQNARLKKITTQAMYMAKQTSIEKSNDEAVKEVIATEHAQAAGMNTQRGFVAMGKWENEALGPKLMVGFEWGEGVSDMTKLPTLARDHFTQNSFENFAFKGSPSKQILAYQKGGQWYSATHLIKDVGKLYGAVFLRHADYDGIGSKFQNKMVRLVHDDTGNPVIEFFGIDFGKAYKTSVQYSDDLSFSSGKKMKNYELFMDTLLSDRMSGVHVIAKQHGIELPKTIAEEFQSDTKEIEENSHLAPFDIQIQMFEGRIKDLNQQMSTKEIDGVQAVRIAKKKIAAYEKIVQNVRNFKQKAIDRDKALLDLMQKTGRLYLTKKELNFLSNFEKLLAGNKIRTTVKDTHPPVFLNHIQLDTKDRNAVNFKISRGKRPLEVTIQGTICYQLSMSKPMHIPQEVLKQLKQRGVSLRGLDIFIPTEKFDTILTQVLTEENIAELARKTYCPPKQKKSFEDALQDDQRPTLTLGTSQSLSPKIPEPPKQDGARGPLPRRCRSRL